MIDINAWPDGQINFNYIIGRDYQALQVDWNGHNGRITFFLPSGFDLEKLERSFEKALLEPRDRRTTL